MRNFTIESDRGTVRDLPLYLGVPGIHKLPWGNSWADPLICYKGRVYSVYTLTDALRGRYEDALAEAGEEYTDNGFDNWLFAESTVPTIRNEMQQIHDFDSCLGYLKMCKSISPGHHAPRWL